MLKNLSMYTKKNFNEDTFVHWMMYDREALPFPQTKEKTMFLFLFSSLSLQRAGTVFFVTGACENNKAVLPTMLYWDNCNFIEDCFS